MIYGTSAANNEFQEDGFELTIEPTGVSQLIIFQDLITNLCNGDEIGVFDSDGILKSSG